MSDTPRTDAMERNAGLPDFPEFARQLERELDAMTIEAKNWKAKCWNMRERATSAEQELAETRADRNNLLQAINPKEE